MLDIQCGCQLRHRSLKAWLCHFEYSGFLEGVKYLLLTKIKFRKE